ncbi:hypothetical protein PISMIDRAFT_337797 [Pisolithus microcarpus 441]|uniref:Uncharacterized protein n=1 Tax=Pisolithus microcarpus 441 TaxID=765257 RepID=A0A0C9Z4Y4_9AGAM|nr:hypothetical protein PISMIDRAFT_337797 [Pisolithus microcarpus 441]
MCSPSPTHETDLTDRIHGSIRAAVLYNTLVTCCSGNVQNIVRIDMMRHDSIR